MNNLSSYCGLVDAKIRASDKDLPVCTKTMYDFFLHKTESTNLKGLELIFAYFQSCFHHHWHIGQWWKLWHKNLLNQLCTMNSFLTKDFLMRLLTRHAGVWAPPQFLTLETKTTCPCSPVCYWGRAKTTYKTWHYPDHGLRTPNEGINQRNLQNWADVADKLCFGRT